MATTDAHTSARIDHLSENSFTAEGRRTFLEFRDLGLVGPTEGKLRGTEYRNRGSDEFAETDWHYHTCDMQFVYVLGGWTDLEFTPGRVDRIVAGTMITIPGGTPHKEIAMSRDYHAIEISLPADRMGTVSIDDPDVEPSKV